ncbi:glycoside hydrolase family 27 protein [Dendrothele bispora CBS 962.96]|uniref:Alpha-galactosidase n=1 Tax=Dendrothele bispora (strain CBS 962.96) TaxID=1314807 RepID=A0A4S8M556_DENBC|nr:glycoside hydrolase family 27 protein [Dendrothele bispora CBS 962.96]
MGWNSYNAFLCDTTEAQYHAQAQTLVSLGLNKLGYQYFNLDCGWQGTSRNSSGGFTWNTATIPSGIPALSNFVHNLGLKFGLYSDGGFFACDFVGGTAHFLGSLGHETSDAASFASWGADYLKYDNCYAVNQTDFVDFNPPIQIKDHMVAMRDALAATGRPILFSACEWGVQDPARWPGIEVANSWRISNDIGPPASWDNLFRIINQVVPITQFAGPGGWNDLDMLEVGNSGLTAAEQQTHFALWAAVKSPLIISTDLTRISSNALSILSNSRIIALNQDSLGKSVVFRRRYTNDHDVWSGPLSDGSTAVVVFNLQNVSRAVTFSLPDVRFTSATAVDLITGKSLGTLTNSFTTTLDGHGSLVLKLTNGVPSSQPTFTFYNAADPANTLGGGASTRVVNSTVTVVGFVGEGGTLTINGVDGGSGGGSKLVSFDYINGDFTFTNTACSNCRNAFVSVNGGTPVQVQMPISGQSWDILFSGYLVSLSGFKPGKTNTIQISNPSAFAPDFFRVGVQK